MINGCIRKVVVGLQHSKSAEAFKALFADALLNVNEMNWSLNAKVDNL